MSNFSIMLVAKARVFYDSLPTTKRYVQQIFAKIRRSKVGPEYRGNKGSDVSTKVLPTGTYQHMYARRASYLVGEPDGWRLEGILFGQVDPDFPHSVLVRCAFGPSELNDELVEATEDGHLVLAFDKLDHVGVHPTLARTRRRHLDSHFLCFYSF